MSLVKFVQFFLGNKKATEKNLSKFTHGVPVRSSDDEVVEENRMMKETGREKIESADP
jgi:hypothetical protein